MQSAQAAFAAQVYPEETLLTPLSCRPQVSSDQPVGAEAAHVTISVQETCQAAVYRTSSLQEHMRQVVTEEAMTSGLAPG